VGVGRNKRGGKTLVPVRGKNPASGQGTGVTNEMLKARGIEAEKRIRHCAISVCQRGKLRGGGLGGSYSLANLENRLGGGGNFREKYEFGGVRVVQSAGRKIKEAGNVVKNESTLKKA